MWEETCGVYLAMICKIKQRYFHCVEIIITSLLLIYHMSHDLMFTHSISTSRLSPKYTLWWLQPLMFIAVLWVLFLWRSRLRAICMGNLPVIWLIYLIYQISRKIPTFAICPLAMYVGATEYKSCYSLFATSPTWVYLKNIKHGAIRIKVHTLPTHHLPYIIHY